MKKCIVTLMTVLALAGTTVTGVAVVSPTAVSAKATNSKSSKSKVAKSKTTVDKIIKATQDKDTDSGKPNKAGSKTINDAMYFKKGSYGYKTPSGKSDKVAKFKKGDSVTVVAVYSKAGGKKLAYKGEYCKWYKTNIGVFIPETVLTSKDPFSIEKGGYPKRVAIKTNNANGYTQPQTYYWYEYWTWEPYTYTWTDKRGREHSETRYNEVHHKDRVSQPYGKQFAKGREYKIYGKVDSLHGKSDDGSFYLIKGNDGKTLYIKTTDVINVKNAYLE